MSKCLSKRGKQKPYIKEGQQYNAQKKNHERTDIDLHITT